MCDKARKRVWTQDVELTLGQHERSLSHTEAAVTLKAATWTHQRLLTPVKRERDSEIER